MKQRVVFVDVDDTLVRSIGTKRIPMPAVIERVRDARESAVELGIEACFLAFLPKPDTYLDDRSVDEWRYCRHVLSNNAGDA